jgi:hypothetical protein
MEASPLIVVNLTARPGEHSESLVVSTEDRELTRPTVAAPLSRDAHLFA